MNRPPPRRYRSFFARPRSYGRAFSPTTAHFILVAVMLFTLAPLHRAAPAKKKPHHRRSTPTVKPVPPGYREEGIASWYGRAFQGRRTASGERYNMYAMTAAHKTLPFGTLVKVTHLSNGREVVVRINDRGPWTRGRIIDLSYAAAKKIGMIQAGCVRVRIEVVTGEQPQPVPPQEEVRQ